MSPIGLLCRQFFFGQSFFVVGLIFAANWCSVLAADDINSIEPGDTVVVTEDVARLNDNDAVVAEIQQGQYLSVLRVRNIRIRTFFEIDGKRTEGWVNIQDVAGEGNWALLFDGKDDQVIVPCSQSQHSGLFRASSRASA